MKEHEFTVLLAAPEEFEDDFDRLYEAQVQRRVHQRVGRGDAY
jgi:hypothetical protein